MLTPFISEGGCKVREDKICPLTSKKITSLRDQGVLLHGGNLTYGLQTSGKESMGNGLHEDMEGEIHHKGTGN